MSSLHYSQELDYCSGFDLCFDFEVEGPFVLAQMWTQPLALKFRRMSALAAVSGGPKSGNQGKVHRGKFCDSQRRNSSSRNPRTFFLLRLRIKSNTHTNISTEGEGIL
ncbi:hypothetical protein L1887_13642 [Cichorium endivia]|nr:hypothetical protein L1887_13642 [Cichorium endivia]